MKITIDKKLIPQLYKEVEPIKNMELFKFDGYNQDAVVLIAPNNDIALNIAINIARITKVEAYPYWVEVPNANLGDNLPVGLSYETYLDDQEPPVEQTRTWADLSESRANQAATATMRYFQPANNGEFLYNDVEILQESGFEVFDLQSCLLKLNAEYDDPGGLDYAVRETIEYIDEQWRFGGYFDFVDAWLTMQELYEAKGATDIDRWNACTTAEKIILVKWNLVGLARANDLIPGSWSEAKAAKELNRSYSEFEENLQIALRKRFKDYFRYLNFSLSGAGRTKFENDWIWDNQHEYIYKAYRFYELGGTNALVNWHSTVLGTYGDSDFIGTIPAATIINVLGNVLVAKKYFL